MREGDAVTVTLEHLTSDGEGAATLEGRELRVTGAFPGERVRARVLHVARQRLLSYGRVLEVEQPDPSRRRAPCAQHPDAGGRCTGCALLPLGEDRQRALKRAMLEKVHGLVVGPLRSAGGDLGYRWSSKRVAFGGAGRLRLGSFVRGSHQPADMAGCLLEHPRLEAAFAELIEATRALRIVAFDERTGRGDLRYVWAKTDGERVLLTLVTAEAESPAAQGLPAALTVPAAIAHSVQPASGNAVRGGSPRMLRGEASLTAQLCGVPVEVGPLGFLQPNPALIAETYRDLVADAEGQPRTGRLALDLYAGAGVTTALLRAGFERVVACESYPESARALGVTPGEVEPFLRAIVEDPSHPDHRPDLVVANPPRGGLGAATCALLLQLGAPALQVMACGPRALAEDLGRLTGEGGYRLVRLEAYDSLPQTPHVELVAWLERPVHAGLGSRA